MQSEARRIQATIAEVAAIAGDAGSVADVAASTWREINTVLSPVIGPGGVSALYQRSLFMTRDAHPCLAAVREDALRPGEFAGLQSVLSQQSSGYVVAVNGALLQTFCDLLASLIGASLSERLLRSVHNFSASGTHGQVSRSSRIRC
jgi:hypothetical protein